MRLKKFLSSRKIFDKFPKRLIVFVIYVVCRFDICEDFFHNIIFLSMFNNQSFSTLNYLKEMRNDPEFMILFGEEGINFFENAIKKLDVNGMDSSFENDFINTLMEIIGANMQNKLDTYKNMNLNAILIKFRSLLSRCQ